MSNYEYLTDKLNIRELARALIKLIANEEYDYNFEEEIYYDGLAYHWETSDGWDFGYPTADEESLEEAIEHEVKWLNSEKEEDDF